MDGAQTSASLMMINVMVILKEQGVWQGNETVDWGLAHRGMQYFLQGIGVELDSLVYEKPIGEQVYRAPLTDDPSILTRPLSPPDGAYSLGR